MHLSQISILLSAFAAITAAAPIDAAPKRGDLTPNMEEVAGPPDTKLSYGRYTPYAKYGPYGHKVDVEAAHIGERVEESKRNTNMPSPEEIRSPSAEVADDVSYGKTTPYVNYRPYHRYGAEVEAAVAAAEKGKRDMAANSHSGYLMYDPNTPAPESEAAKEGTTADM